MTTHLEEGNLWIQTSCRPGEGWALLGYSCPKHAIWVALHHDNESVIYFSSAEEADK